MTTPMSNYQLRERVFKLPLIDDSSLDLPWQKNRLAMREHFMSSQNIPNEILRWSTVQATMFVGEFHVTQLELQELMSCPRWKDYAKYALPEREFGNPQRMGTMHFTSGNLIHQCYHLWQWESRTMQEIRNAKRIVEFGGGYGAMCAIARRLGFQGDYFLIDLPEFSLLQEYYLSNIGIEADYIACDFDTDFSDITPEDIDLFFAIHSLSETPIEFRDNFINSVDAMSWLITYQNHFYDYDNVGWFRRLCDDRSNYKHNLFVKQPNQNINYLVSSMAAAYV